MVPILGSSALIDINVKRGMDVIHAEDVLRGIERQNRRGILDR